MDEANLRHDRTNTPNGHIVGKAKRVLPYITGQLLQQHGLIGATPELYAQINLDKAFGIFVGFSGSATAHNHHCKLNTHNLLGVLNHAYTTDQSGINLPLQFTIPDDTREAFILGNKGCKVSVISSTGWLDDISYEKGKLSITSGSLSNVKIRIPENAKDIKSQNTDIVKLSHDIIEIELSPGKATNIYWSE